MTALTPYELAQREALIIERRADRVPMRTIAAELSISVQRVSQIYAKACDRIPAQRLDIYRDEERELADAAVEDLRKIIRDPKTSATNKIKGWEAIVKVMERRARLLGLDSATKREIELYDSSLWEARLREEIAAEERAIRIAQAITVDHEEIE